MSTLFDEILTERWRTNPLDVPEDSPSLPRSARRDVVLGDTLALGHGSDDDTGAAAPLNTHQHVRSYLSFTPVAKRSRVMGPRELDEDLALKCWQVNEAFWPQIRHLSLSSDGFRASRKDVNYFAFASTHADRVRVGWGMQV